MDRTPTKSPLILEVATAAFICFLILVFVFISANCASAQERPKRLSGAQTALVIGSALDGLTTEIALRGPGFKEGNPVLGSSMPQRIAIKAAGTAGLVWMVGKVAPRHPRLAKAIGFGGGVFFGGVAVHNWRLQ